MSLILDVCQQGNMMKVKVNQKMSNIANFNRGGGTRGRISGFSGASRKRLLELFAGLNARSIKKSGCVFVTLTYGQTWPDPEEAKRDMRAFLRRIQRRTEMLNPSFLWKMEPQERGAPHFHICIFGWKKTKDGWPLTTDDFTNLWGDVIDVQHWNWSRVDESGDVNDVIPPQVDVSMIRSFRKMMYYVSKYMAKPFNVSEGDTEPKKSLDHCPGQESGPVGGGSAEGTEAPCENGFINLAYLSTDGKKIDYIGRSWGVLFKANLPEAPKNSIMITCNQNFEDFHRLVRWKWARISRDQRGFTVFHEQASDWYDIFLRYWGHIEEVPF